MAVDVKLNAKQWEAFDLLTNYDNGVSEVLYGGGSRGGKMTKIDEVVCTPFGFRMVKDLKVGDIITSAETGGQQRITYLHPIGTYEFYRVSFNDGTYLDCSEGHLWQVHVSSKRTKRKDEDGKAKNQRVWETTQIREWLRKQKEEGVNQGKHILIPLCKPVQFTFGRKKERYIDPYVLGVLIGDGSLSSKGNYVAITTPDEFIVNKIKQKGYSVTKHETRYKLSDNYSIKGLELNEGLVKLGLKGHTAKTKFIPNVYKFAPLEDRKALIRGLMDTDGYVDDRGHMSYTTISEQLAEDVAFVVRSLGGKATITKGKAGYKKDGEYHQCNDAYDVTFSCSLAKELVSLPKKLERVRDFYPSQCQGKQIISVEPIGKFTSRCISVDDVSGLYVTKDFTVTHNSWLGCFWQITRRLTLPGSVGFICRREYARLVDTTMKTFFEVVDFLGVRDEFVFRTSSSGGKAANAAYFSNGSMIYFRYLDYDRNDPNYDRFGSYGITDLFGDEAQELDEKAISVLRGRFSLLYGKNPDGTEWHTTPKSMYSCNPRKNWIYNDFVKPAKEGTLPSYRRFIPALPKDNPYITQDYLDNLLRSDKVTVQRLYYGNFDYDDDPTTLCDYDAISDLFHNEHVEPVGMKSASADIATKGHDRFVVYSWIGNVAYIRVDKEYSPGKQVQIDLENVLKTDGIPRSFCVVDADGVGSFVESYVTGIKEFHGGHPAKDKKYLNKRSECYFKLADLINERKIRVVVQNEDQKKALSAEIGILKQAAIDNDTGKKRVISKEEMKQLLGRSPDYMDGLMMAMDFRTKTPVATQTSGMQVKVTRH